MSEEKTKVKSDLQQRLESEGWKFMTNMPLFNGRYYDPNAIQYLQWLEQIRTKYGENNVRHETAHDIYGHRITDMQAIYVRESRIAERKEGQ